MTNGTKVEPDTSAAPQSPADAQADALPPEFDRLIEQVKAEDEAAQRASLSSWDSFLAWLGQSGNVGLLNTAHQYGPALLEMVKRIVGV